MHKSKPPAPDPERPWFETAFDVDYAARYAHRDHAQAEQEMRFLLSTLQLPASAKVLDLCCGSGRHLRIMIEHGLQAEGLDLSADLLALAQADGLPVTRADMRRLPYADRAFRAVFNLFTSFGYFDEAENTQALCEMARVLVPGGQLVLDVLNPTATLTQLQPHTEKAIAWECNQRKHARAGRLVERRRYDAVTQRLEKRVRFLAPDGNSAQSECYESVRVYFEREWVALLAAGGLKLQARYGTLNGDAFDELTSPRQVIVAMRI
ncbi:MAG TPA: class I SAM-dependent methyltransferase [Planctomycetota bacterium]|nr:class I SAM-dependent methyltransferase [Planctomycetota bacterium]